MIYFFLLSTFASSAVTETIDASAEKRTRFGDPFTLDITEPDSFPLFLKFTPDRGEHFNEAEASIVPRVRRLYISSVHNRPRGVSVWILFDHPTRPSYPSFYSTKILRQRVVSERKSCRAKGAGTSNRIQLIENGRGTRTPVWKPE